MAYRTTIVENVESFPNPDRLKKILTTIINVNDKFSEGTVDDSLWFMDDNVPSVPGATHYHKADGGGNDLDIVFLHDGSCLVFGFDHETVEAAVDENQPVFEGLPRKFAPLLTDENLVWSDTGNVCASIAFWWDTDEGAWDFATQHMNDQYEFDDGGFKFFFDDLIGFDSNEWAHGWVNKTGAPAQAETIAAWISQNLR